MTLLVIDVGTSGLRAAAINDEAQIIDEEHRELLPDTPAPGLVEFDALAMADAALDVARIVAARVGKISAVGVANQRTSSIVWDRTTGVPIGPGLGWQDLRTVGECLVLQGEGIRLAPNHSATKAAWIINTFDPDRTRDLCFGTVDSWIVWTLTGGTAHVTDLTNQSVTGLMNHDANGWDERILDALRLDPAILPKVVDSTGVVAEASVLEGSPPIAGILGDQQASLLGQGCVTPGSAKITFGTGAMLDLVVGDTRPSFEQRGNGGTFVLAAWQVNGEPTWAIESIMLSAGTNVEWLRDDLGIIDSAAESDALAAQCETTDGVMYVPALLGLGTPHWDYGARGTLVGLTRGTERPQIARAVLEGVAHRGADLVEAAEEDSKQTIPSLRVDGGMTANRTFVQALANASQRPVEVSPVREATALGAAYAAGLATGVWSGMSDIAAIWAPQETVEPNARLDREKWSDAVSRSAAWHADLSALDF